LVNRIGTVLLLIGLVATAAIGAAAQSDSDYRVRVYTQPDQDITELQTVRLVIEAEGQGRPKLSVSGLSKATNLQIVAGPERVFNSTWANGRMTARTSLVYTLLPRAPGPAIIPALSLEVDGEQTMTSPIRFEVLPAPAGVPPRPAPGTSRSGAVEERADVFLRAQLGSSEVWVGESVSLSVLLYSGERISSPSLAGEPSLSSFWVEEMDVDPNAEASRATVEGRPYVVYPVKRKILVPQTSGDIDIEPFVLQIPVQVRRGDGFESLFSFGRTRTVVRKSQPLQLKVRPLPVAGRPDDFGGAVGEYTLQLSTDRQEADVNDAVALTATVEGEGFLRAIAPPTLDTPPDIKVFDPKVSSSSRSARGVLVSRKTWEWVLVPLVPGELKIPALRFPYFDPTSGSYRVASAEPPLLVVRQNGGTLEPSVSRADIRLQRRDLAFIKPLRGTLRHGAPRAHERGLFVGMLLLPLIWGPAVVFAGRHRAKLRQNLGLARARRARGHARQRLRAAAKHLEATDAARFHEEVARALVEYVSDRFNRSAAGLTYEMADELLASRGLGGALRRRFRACLETCDFARFVPSASASERRAEVLTEAKELIDQLEKAR
jgi:hypothetical protein